jgi:phosphoglycolate phosphatase
MIVTHVLFDLDGTLVDTAPEIADAVNASLHRIGRPAVTLDQVRDWVGHGARRLLEKALAHHAVQGEALPPLDVLWRDFEIDYLECCGTRSVLYPGVREGLDRLREQGRSLAVLTNKEGVFTHKVLSRHDLATHFDLIVAGDTLAVRKPDPGTVLHALQTMDAEPEDALLIGDSAVDVEVARRAGIAVWCVDYGYHHGELHGDFAPDRMITTIEAAADLPQRIAIA